MEQVDLSTTSHGGIGKIRQFAREANPERKAYAIASLSTDFAMHYEDDDFTDPWRGAETVILHHGQAKNGRLWYAWVPLLAREYRVIRLDARGFGESSVPTPGYRWSLEGFAEDVLHLMDHLNIERAHFVGENGRRDYRPRVCPPVPETVVYGDRIRLPLQVSRRCSIRQMARPS